MQNIHDRFNGVFTALITPFRDGSVDLPAFDALVERQLEAGVAGLVPLSPQRGEGDGRCRQGARPLPGQGRLVLLPLQRRGASAGREPDYTGPHFSACQRIHRMRWQLWVQQHTP